MDINTSLGMGSLPEGFVTPNLPQVTNNIHRVHGLQHVQLTISGLVIPVTTALVYGSAKIALLPRRNLVLMNAEAKMTALKGNIATGIVAATSVSFGVGTAIASNTVLSTTMQNVVPITTDAASHLLAVFGAPRFAAVAATTPLSIPESATAALFLNCASAATTVDDTLTFNGTLDLWYFDLGNVNNA